MSAAPSTLRLPLAFDPQQLQADLGRFSAEDWVPHFNRPIYEGDWSGIALRALPGADVALFSDPFAKAAFADSAAMQRLSYIPSVLEAIPCPKNSVRLLKLAAGSSIRRHRDYYLGPEDGEVRLHVPVRTNADVDFVLDDQRVPMAEGELWFLNFNKYHSVDNRSREDRIHLVIDCVVNGWLRQLLEGSGPGEASDRFDQP
jgi:hypothetical protein